VRQVANDQIRIEEYMRSYKFRCSKDVFVPKYLWYLFEAKGMDKSKIICFDEGNYRFNEDGTELKEVK